jgi:hypothetical protein
MNSMVPSMCFDTLVGDDLNLLLIEYGMTDACMECTDMTQELMIRRALEMEKQAVTQHIGVGGGRHKSEMPLGNPNKDEYDSHVGGDLHERLRQHYGALGFHHMEMYDGLHSVDHLEGWAHEDLFVTWHPGPKGHRFIADQLLYYHMVAFLMALDILRDAPTFVRQRRALPPPLACGEWCGAPSSKADCFTSFQPRARANKALASAMTIAGRRVSALAVLNGTEAVALRTKLATGCGVEWRRVISETEVLHPERGYLDYKLAWCATGGAEPMELSVTVPPGGVGSVILCRPVPHWAQLEEKQGLLVSPDVNYKLDGVEVAPDAAAVGGIATCHCRERDVFAGECVIFGRHLAPGPHTLQVTPTSDNFQLIAHVIGI